MNAFIAYLGATGLVTSAAMVGRGLVRSARHLLEGEYAQAGTQALSALAAPMMLAHAATAAMVLDFIAGAIELVGDVLADTPNDQQARQAA